jgi:hypothetical protein
MERVASTAAEAALACRKLRRETIVSSFVLGRGCKRSRGRDLIFFSD